jgi:hypothetical protein
METLLQPDDALLFEARVFIDGECVAYVVPYLTLLN